MFSREAIKKTPRQRQYLVSVAFFARADDNTALFEWQLAVTRYNLYLFWFQYFVIEARGVGRHSLQFTWSAQKTRDKGWWQKISRCNEWVAYWRPAESRFGAYSRRVFVAETPLEVLRFRDSESSENQESILVLDVCVVLFLPVSRFVYSLTILKYNFFYVNIFKSFHFDSKIGIDWKLITV